MPDLLTIEPVIPEDWMLSEPTGMTITNLGNGTIFVNTGTGKTRHEWQVMPGGSLHIPRGCPFDRALRYV